MENMLFAEQNASACSAKRLPTSRWPVYSTTLRAVIPAGQTSAEVSFEAERDTVFTNLSVSGYVGDAPALGPVVSAKYCNTVILDGVLWNVFSTCCLHKPLFIQEVRNKKELKFTVTLGAPIGTDSEIKISLQGLQGAGCCD